MKSREETAYRLRLAKGYIDEAKKLFDVGLWRACVGSCQLAVENACKVIIALFRPVVKTHEVSRLLLELLAEEEFTKEEIRSIERLIDYAKILGLKDRLRRRTYL
jgi:HEPN domain-containing protein